MLFKFEILDNLIKVLLFNSQIVPGIAFGRVVKELGNYFNVDAFFIELPAKGFAKGVGAELCRQFGVAGFTAHSLQHFIKTMDGEVTILLAWKKVVILIMVVEVVEVVDDFGKAVVPKKSFCLASFLLNHSRLGFVQDVANAEGNHIGGTEAIVERNRDHQQVTVDQFGPGSRFDGGPELFVFGEGQKLDVFNPDFSSPLNLTVGFVFRNIFSLFS